MELMYQVLDRYPRFFGLIRPIFLDLKRMKQNWDIRSLSQAILHIPHLPPAATGCRDHITFFIDALDENHDRDNNSTLLSIFDNLVATYRNVRNKPDAPVLKICLASRPWPIFRKRLGNDPRVPSFAIHNFTLQDIQQYTTTRLIKALSERQATISQLSADISSRAKGVFIWVRVVVDNLRQEIIDGTPIESLQKSLHQYPTELDDMYKLTLQRIAPAYRPESLILFKTILASRVPLAILGVYAATCICQGTLMPDDGPTESLDVITTWLASRSGGLIDIVDTGAREAPSVASGTDKEAKMLPSASEFPARPNPQVEFLHQTVQDFVRRSLANTLKVTQTESSVAQASGSRLLALACLDRHPPHRYLRNVAEDIFTFLREVEREEDDTQDPQLTTLPGWGSYDIHDFPFKTRVDMSPFYNDCTTSRTISYYLNPENPLTPMVLGQDNELHDKGISEIIRPILITILHNLYRTNGSKYVTMIGQEYSRAVSNISLVIASVGPRFSNERIDRPRMFRHILGAFATPLWARFPSNGRSQALGSPFRERVNQQYLVSLSYKPVVEFIDSVSIPELPIDPIRLFACLKPSTEVDDNTLLEFAEGLREYPVEHSEECITVKVPFPSTQGPDEQESECRTVRMTPIEFCSRFRQANLTKWAEILQPFNGAEHTFGLDHESQRFLDIALYDALNRKPPRHAYTRLANSIDREDTRQGPVTRQVIASACIPAAVVGLGSNQIFRAFYQVGHHGLPRPSRRMSIDSSDHQDEDFFRY